MESIGTVLLVFLLIIFIIVIFMVISYNSTASTNNNIVALNQVSDQELATQPPPEVSNLDTQDKYAKFNETYSQMGQEMFNLVDVYDNAGELSRVRSKIDSQIEELGQLLCSERDRNAFVNIYKSKITTIIEYVKTANTIDMMDSSFSSEGDHTPTGYYSGSGDDAKLNKLKMQLQLLSAALAEALSKCVSIKVEKLAAYFAHVDASIIKYNTLRRKNDVHGSRTFREQQSKLWHKLRLGPKTN